MKPKSLRWEKRSELKGHKQWVKERLHSHQQKERKRETTTKKQQPKTSKRATPQNSYVYVDIYRKRLQTAAPPSYKFLSMYREVRFRYA